MLEESQIGHRVCTRDRLRDEIVRRILDGRYPPDMHLKELILAKEFGTSQAPVREALRDLEALGLVESIRYRGTRVRSTSAVDLREAYELRSLIESRSAQLAVPCKPEDLQVMAKQVEALHTAAHNRDPEAFTQAALIFHRLIVEMSGNQQFLKAFDAMLWGVRARISIYRKVDELVKHAADHVKILECLTRGDGDAAAALLKKKLGDAICALGSLGTPAQT